MSSALAWGALASSSLVVGALLAGVRAWPARQIGMVLAFGAGALISAIGFELAAEGLEVGGLRATAAGLGAGALVYYALDGATREAGRVAGLLTTLGFAVATALSSVS